MRIIRKDLREGRIAVGIYTADDLWLLSQIIEPEDLVRAKTTRKIKVGGKEEAAKKTMTLTVSVEDLEFTQRTLRINGKTVEETEEVPKGSYHSITLEEGSSATITKKQWHPYHLARLDEATQKQETILLLILDREEALFALLKSQGYEILSEIKGKVAKKGMETITGNFYGELERMLADYEERYKPSSIIVASPAFWKDDFLKEMKKEELRKRIVLATCSSVGTNAIEETLKRSELKEVLHQQRASQEAIALEELMREIAKDGLAAYGKAEIETSIATGNVQRLLITDTFIQNNRKESEQLMKAAEAVKAAVTIINAENEAGRKLNSLGGIGALLRYKQNY